MEKYDPTIEDSYRKVSAGGADCSQLLCVFMPLAFCFWLMSLSTPVLIYVSLTIVFECAEENLSTLGV